MSGLALGLPFALGFQVLRSFSTALSRAVPPLVVMALAILWNAGFDYALIFGHFGLPRLGLSAPAWPAPAPTFSASWPCWRSAWAMPALKRYRILHRLVAAALGDVSPNCSAWACPSASPWCSRWRCSTAPRWLMGTFGLASLAAHQIAITIPSLTFMIPLGIGLAATVRVGLAAGAGDRNAARRAGFTAIGMGAAFMCGTALVLLLWPREIASLWLPDIAENAGCAGAGGELPACRRRVPVDGRDAGDRRHEPARSERHARADVAGGRLLLAGGRAHVRDRWACSRAARASASGWVWPSACWWRR